MITLEQIIEEAVQILDGYGTKYASITSLIKCQQANQFFFLEFLDVAKHDWPDTKDVQLNQHHKKLLRLILKEKLSQFQDWQQVDFEEFITAIRYLKKNINFNPKYEYFHADCPVLFDAFQLIDILQGDCRQNSKFVNKFLSRTLNFLYSSGADQWSQISRDKGKILAINHLDQNRRQLTATQKQEYLNFFNSTSPEIIQSLLQAKSKQVIQEVRLQVSEMQLIKEDGSWRLIGQCRINTSCLTSEILVKCFSTCRLNYRFLLNHFFTETQTQIIFKYDIFMLNIIKNQIVQFGVKDREYKCRLQLKEDLLMIFANAIYLINVGLSHKIRLFIYRIDSLQAIEEQQLEKVVIVCLQMMQYCLRILNEQNKHFQIMIDVPGIDLQICLCKAIQYLLSSPHKIQTDIVYNICYLLCLIKGIDGHEHIVAILLSHEDQHEKDLVGLFSQLMKRFIGEDKDGELEYYTGMWFMRFSTLLQDPKKSLGENYNHFCCLIFDFIVKNNKHRRVNNTECEIGQFLTFISNFLIKNSSFSINIFPKWTELLQQLQKIQRCKQIQQYNWHILATIFCDNSFPQTQELKQKLVNLIDFLKLQNQSLKNEKSQIWDGYLQKTNLNFASQMNLLLQITKDKDILSNNWKQIYFFHQPPENLKSFVYYICKVQIFVSLVPKPIIIEQVKLLSTLVLRLQLIIIRFQQETIRQLCGCVNTDNQLAKDLYSCYSSNHSFRKTFQSRLRIIGSYHDLVYNIISSNQVILGLGQYLEELHNNFKDPYFAAHILKLIGTIVKETSVASRCAFQAQFYNYHKEKIIEVLQEMFDYYQFKFDIKCVATSLDLDFTFNLPGDTEKKLKKWQQFHVPHLQRRIKQFINMLLDKRSWQSNSAIINNIKYQKVNDNYFFWKSLISDLANRLSKVCSISNLNMFYHIFNFDYQFNYKKPELLKSDENVLDVPLPAQPLLVLKSQADSKIYFDNFTHLQRQLFVIYRQCSNQDFDILQSIIFCLRRNIGIKDYELFKLQSIKLYYQCLVYHLTQPNLDWARYERIHCIIGVDYIQYMDINIAQAMPSRYIQLELGQIVRSMNLGRINQKNAFFFINFLDRMIPSSQPQQYDENFYRYAMTVFRAAILLRKMVKISNKLTSQKKLLYLRRLFQIKSRHASTIFDNQIIELSQSIEQVGSFSLIFCDIAQKYLRMPCLQLEVKSIFFKNQQYLAEGKHQNWIRLTRVLALLLKKNKNRQDQLAKVLQAITYKKCIKEQQGETIYITLKSQSPYYYSTFLSSNFADNNLENTLKYILSAFIDRIDWNDDDNIKKFLPQLRVIMQQYPILKGLILMHLVQGPKEKEIPFINLIVGKALSNGYNDKEIQGFFVDAVSDQSFVINNQGRSVFLSEIICYRLVASFYKQKIASKVLAFIYFLSRVKRFVNMCFKKLHKNFSLCDLLWQKLQQFDFIANSGIRSFICIVLSLLYRSKHMISALSLKLKKDNEFSDQKWSIFINHLQLTTKKAEDKSGQQKQKNTGQAQEDHVDLHSGNYRALYKLDYKSWHKLGQYSRDDYSIQGLSLSQIRVKEDYQRYVGESLKIQQKKSRENRSTYRIFQMFDFQQCEKIHKQTFSRLCSHLISPNFHYNNSLPTGCLYVHQNNFSIHKKSPKMQDISQINLPYQSRYAPQEIQKTTEDFLEKLSIQLATKIIDKTIQQLNQKLQSQIYNKLDGINKKLVQLQKKPVNIKDISGKSKEQALQSLQQIELEIEFDSNLIAMSCQEFQSYCLSNISRLNRLKSDRNNIVRRIQDEMMLSFVQRSVSSDSVGYVIDTIDENYKYLSDLKKQPPIARVQKSQSLTSSEKLPSHIFEDVSDENIYQIILSLYGHCQYLPIDFITPFIENKRIQPKIINTILIISKAPLQTKNFPNLNHYKRWILDFREQIFQKNIMEALSIGHFYSFYHTQNYLNNAISFEGVKGLKNQSLFQSEEQTQTYNPIYDCIDFILDCLSRNRVYSQNYDYSQYFFAFKGVKAISQNQWIRLIYVLHEMERQLSYPRSILDRNIYEKLKNDMKRYQIGVYLKSLLKSKKSRQRILQKFPLENEQRNLLFICILKDTGVYRKEDLLAKHRSVIANTHPSCIYFSYSMLTLYSEEDLKDISWLTQSQHFKVMAQALTFELIMEIVPNLPVNYKKGVLYKQINEFKQRIIYSEGDKIVAQRRKGIFQSAFHDLRTKPDAFWYQKFFVKFKNEQDRLQSGHGGGVQKYWYSLLTSEMANLNYGIFAKTSKNYYFFNRESWINPRHHQYLQFIGKLFALSVIRQDLFLTPSFSILLYKMILGEKIELKDVIAEFDEGQVIKNVEKLREYTDNSQFCETFTYEDKRLISRRKIQNEIYPVQPHIYLVKEAIEVVPTSLGACKMKNQQEVFEEMPIKMIKVLKVGEIIELVPGGSNIPVTLQNREQFIALTKQKILSITTEQAKQQFDAFVTGFSRICRPSFIRNLTASELRDLAEGFTQINAADIKKSARIESKIEEKTIKWFWECLQQLKDEERRFFIQHWTGLPKIPIEGVQALNLRIVKGNTDRLYAQTCFNKIYIPEVQSKAKMSQLMEIVVNSIKLGTSIIED